MKPALIQNILCLTLITLFSLNGFSQLGSESGNKATPAGLIIKFSEQASYSRQQQIISAFPDLLLIDEKTNSLLPKVSFAKFLPGKISDDKITALKKELENLEEIVFVNTLIAMESGHFSAPLGEFYVKLFSKNDYPELEKLAVETQIKILKEYHYMPNVFILSADKNSRGNSKEMAIYFSEKKIFQYASANMMFSLEDCSPNDQLYNRQWSIENTGTSVQFNGTPGADMHVDSAWTITTGDSTIKVAVLDSGVDTAHADLLGNLLPGFDATDTTNNNSKGYPNTNFPEDGHGTCCAGIIAAVANNTIGVAGVAYNCKIIPVKMFYYINPFGSGPLPYSTNQWGLDAINWTWQTANADVVSNSWGIPDSLMSALGIDTVVSNDAINNAVANGRNGKGLPMLFSAGNEPDTFCLWPARTPATIAVAATTMCDELKTISDCSPENWASNHGTGLDISAPGVKIASTDITGLKGFSGGNYYLAFNGTSAACPNAAGVMALILSANKNLTSQQAREVISWSCEKVGGYSYNVSAPYGSWSMELGYGRVNAFKAVQVALGKEEIQKGKEFDFFIYRDNAGKNQIHYKLSSSSNVTIEIFDILGRKLKTISEGIKNAGNYTCPISSNIHPTGIYLVRIMVDENAYGGKFIGESGVF